MKMFDVKTLLTPGMHYVVAKMLIEADTAANASYGSKQLGPLMASHVFVGMMVDAALGVVETRLPAGLVSVGRAMKFTHDEPTCLGMNIRVKAVLKEIVGDRLFFDIEAWDDFGPIGHGTHERAVVSRDELFKRAKQRFLREK
jgi:fluoroacetyl-CoA thioesterase